MTYLEMLRMNAEYLDRHAGATNERFLIQRRVRLPGECNAQYLQSGLSATCGKCGATAAIGERLVCKEPT
jgi:glycine cleavage system regulatory protein